MDDTGIKAVIFDLGNVCIDFDHTIAAGRISRIAGVPAEEISHKVFASGICRQFEEGRITPEGFFSAVARAFHLTMTYNQFLPIWNEIFFLTESNSELQQLARRLKRDYAIAMLSNINVLHFQYLMVNFPFFDLFDKLILSFEQHLRKPDPMIYRKALGVLDLKPGEVIYTDDREDFTEAASALGIKSFYYQGPDKLKKDLLSAGINVDQPDD